MALERINPLYMYFKMETISREAKQKMTMGFILMVKASINMKGIG